MSKVGRTGAARRFRLWLGPTTVLLVGLSCLVDVSPAAAQCAPQGGSVITTERSTWIATAATGPSPPSAVRRTTGSGAAPPRPENPAAANKLFQQGNDHFMRQRYVQAVSSFKKALKLWDHAAIRFNLAVCFIHLGKPAVAYRHLVRAIRAGKANLGRKWQEAQSYHKLLQRRVAQLKITSKSKGAEISLNGRRLFTGPGEAELVLPPGRHHLVATRPKHVTVSRHIFAQSGKRTSYKVTLLKGDRAFCYRSFHRYHWGVPTATTVAATAALASGIALLVQGRTIINNTAKTVEQNYADGIVTSPEYVSDRQRRGQWFQGGGIATLLISAALTTTSILLWLYRSRKIDYKTQESLLTVPF